MYSGRRLQCSEKTRDVVRWYRSWKSARPSRRHRKVPARIAVEPLGLHQPPAEAPKAGGASPYRGARQTRFSLSFHKVSEDPPIKLADRRLGPEMIFKGPEVAVVCPHGVRRQVARGRQPTDVIATGVPHRCVWDRHLLPTDRRDLPSRAWRSRVAKPPSAHLAAPSIRDSVRPGCLTPVWASDQREIGPRATRKPHQHHPGSEGPRKQRPSYPRVELLRQPSNSDGMRTGRAALAALPSSG